MRTFALFGLGIWGLAELDQKTIVPGVQHASHSKVAETTKAIETKQRDLKVALMTMLSISFHKLGRGSYALLDAAGTKWSLRKSKPSPVGARRTGVDSEHLSSRADMLGERTRTIKRMKALGSRIKSAGVKVLGLSLKQDGGDQRSSGTVAIVKDLCTYAADLFVSGAPAEAEEARREYIAPQLQHFDEQACADGPVAAVAQQKYAELSAGDLRLKLVEGGVLAMSKLHLIARPWKRRACMAGAFDQLCLCQTTP